MTELIIGLILWVAAHLYRRLAPAARAELTERWGTKSKGVLTILILVALGLIVLGYRGIYDHAAPLQLYTPPPGAIGINQVLMLLALVSYSAGMSKGVIFTVIRHPQLWGASLWAVAHLLVTGDLAAVLLFGTMLIWAQASIILINRAEGKWLRPVAGAVTRDLGMVAAAILAFGAIGWIHIALGLDPFLGTFG